MKRLFAFLLAFVMVLGMFPISQVHATEAEEPVVEVSIPEETSAPAETVEDVEEEPTVAANVEAAAQSRIIPKFYSSYWETVTKTEKNTRTIKVRKDLGNGYYTYEDKTITDEVTYQDLVRHTIDSGKMDWTQDENHFRFSSFSDLQELIPVVQDMDETYLIYTGEGPLVIEADITLPTRANLTFSSDDNNHLIIAAGVTMANDGSIYIDVLEIAGTLVNRDTCDVHEKLTVTGEVRNTNGIILGHGSQVVGAENIISERGGWIQENIICATMEEVMAGVDKARGTLDRDDWGYTLDLYTRSDVTFGESLTIPRNCHTIIHCEDEYGGLMTFTLEENAGITLENCQLVLNAKAVVEGTLTNDGGMVYIPAGTGATLTVSEQGQYEGNGTIFVNTVDAQGTHYSDVIKGLNFDEFLIEEVEDGWNLRSVAGMTVLAAPTDLTWNKEFTWDNNAGKNILVDKPGMISFKPAEPNQGGFELRLFYETENGYETKEWTGMYWDEVPVWISDDVFIRTLPETGNYYFEVRAYSEFGDCVESPWARSEVYHYTKPSEKMPTPQNLRFEEVQEDGEDQIRVVWDGEPAKAYVNWYFCRTPKEDPINDCDASTFYTTWYTEKHAYLDDWFRNECGEGYYYCTVRAFPENIEEVYFSDRSEVAGPYHYFDAVGTIREELKNAIAASQTPEQAQAAAQALDREYLTTAIIKDREGTTWRLYSQLEDIAGGRAQVKVSKGFSSIDAEDVYVVGANLNTPASADAAISLEIGKSAKTHTLPENLDISNAIGFSMQLDNAKAMSVPAVVLLPAPEGINPQDVVVIHHGAEGDEVLKTVEVGPDCVRVLVTEMGDFTITADIFTQEELMAAINEAIDRGDYYYYLDKSVVLTEDFTLAMPENGWYFNLNIENGSLTVPEGVTLSLDCFGISIHSGGSLNINGQLDFDEGFVDVYGGTLAVGATGKVNVPSGSISMDLTEGGKVIGIPESEMNASATVSAEDEIHYYFDTYKDIYRYINVYLQLENQITLTKDLEVPGNCNLWYYEASITVPSGITLTAEGDLNVNENSVLNIEKGAKLINNGCLTVFGLLNMNGTYNGAGILDNYGTLNGNFLYLRAEPTGRLSLEVKAFVNPEDPNAEFVWEIISGKDFITLESNGNRATITQTKPVTEPQEVVYKVSTKDGKLSNTVSGWIYPEETKTGKCGENLTWVLENEVLTISGSGAMYDYESGAPWQEDTYRIQKVVIGKDVTTIGAYAFAYCNALERIDIHAGITSIGEGAFALCTSLKEFKVSTSNKKYCNDASGVLFDKDKRTLIQAPGAISGTYKVPDTVTTIGSLAFYGAAKLTGIELPDGIPTIPYGAFGECYGLTEVKIPDSVTTIDFGAFWNCTGLQSIEIPAGVKTIGGIAFEDCLSLTTVTFKGDAPEIGEDAFTGVKATAYYPENNPTWTEAARANYGGNLTWVARAVATKLSAPKVSAANDSLSGKPVISWDAISAADSYEIFRSTSKTKGYSSIGTIADTIYQDDFVSAGKTYYYKVKAICAADDSLSSEQSKAVTAKCLYPRPYVPMAVGPGAKRNDAKGNPLITWEASEGAKKYDVYYSTSLEGTYKKLATTTSTSYTHTKAASGVGYYYKICAYGSSAAYASSFSNVMYAIRKMPAPSLTVKADNDTGRIAVTWKKVTGATEYELQCSVNGGEYETVIQWENLYFVHENLVVGDTYSYRIRALCDNQQMWSEYSDEKTAFLKCGKPLLIITHNEIGKPVLIWEPVDSAAEYEIQMATSSKGKYKTLETVTEANFIHFEAEAGKTYYYKVRALDANGNAGDFCSYKSATAKFLAPVITEASNNASGYPVIKWEKVDGAKKYDVYYSKFAAGPYNKLTSTSSTSYTHTKAITGWCNYYRVAAYGSSTASMGEFSEIVPIIRKVATPSITVTTDQNKGTAKITWKKISGAIGYELQCSINGGEFATVETITGTSYTYTGMTVGNTYTFRLSAVAEMVEASSEYSAEKTAFVKCGKPVLTASNDAAGKPVLEWNEIPGAATYEIQMATSSKGKFKTLATVTDSGFIHADAEGGKTIYYKVRAIDANGNAGDYSAVKSAVCLCLAPQNVVATTNNSGYPMVKWEKVAGAKKYEVWYKTGADGEFKKLTTTSSTSYTYSKAKIDQEYYFKIRAYGASTASLSDYSEIVCGIRKLAQPSLTVTANQTKRTITVKWKKVTNAVSYELQYSINGGEFETVPAGNFLSFVHEDVQPGNKYTYRVRAISENEKISGDYCAEKSVTIKVGKPTLSITLSESGKPQVSWEAVEGAVEYQVYYATSKKGKYKLVETTEELSFIYEEAKAGKTCYFKVKAVDVNGNTGDYSSAKSIKSK